MTDPIKTFSQDFIDKHLEQLPDAASCEDDEIEHQIFEGFEPNSSERPTHLTVLYLVFGKNETKDGWVFLGYHY